MFIGIGMPLTRLALGGAANKIVAHGDSITSTVHPTADPTQNYSRQLVSLITSRQATTYTLVQQGISGHSWNYAWPSSGNPNTLLVDAITNVDPHVGPNNILIAFAGTNGMALNGRTAAQEAADADTYIAARIAAGWTASNIYILACLPRENSSDNSKKLADYNVALRSYAASRGCKFVALDENSDIGRDGQQANTTWFPDLIHPTVLGHTTIAEEIFDAIYPSYGWTPSTIASAAGGSVLAWYDAQDANTLFTDAGVTLATAGQAVYQWNDKSGNAQHLTQPTLANRPTHSTIGSKVALSFDGSNDWLESPTVSSMPATMSFAHLVKWATSANQVSIDASTDGATSNNFAVKGQAFGIQATNPNGSISGTWNDVTAYVQDGASSKPIVNGADVFGIGGNTTFSTVTKWRIGRGFNSGFQQNGLTGEAILISGRIYAVGSRRLSKYIAARWGNLDFEQDTVSFTDLTGQTTSTAVTSNTITIAGLDSTATKIYAVCVNDGFTTFNVNGGTFGTTAQTVTNGDTIQLKMTTAGTGATTRTGLMKIGRKWYYWSTRTA